MTSLLEVKRHYAIQTRSQNGRMRITVADPGFPLGGGANSPRAAPTYDFAKISKKLHEIERIWARGGVPHAPLRSATASDTIHELPISRDQVTGGERSIGGPLK